MAILKAFLSELPSGAFAMLATLLGFVLGLLSGVIVWLWKAYGIRHMLADEVELNWKVYRKLKAGESWPVRKVTRNAVEC